MAKKNVMKNKTVIRNYSIKKHYNFQSFAKNNSLLNISKQKVTEKAEMC